MPRQQFEEHVTTALESLPQPIKDRLENIDVLVAMWPTREQLQEQGIRSKYGLLGLYEGVPITKRDTHYGMVLPDRITIFQGPIETIGGDAAQIEQEIRRTVVHEIAHYFGIGDRQLHAWGY
ncbi:MAG: metallopeptidase family protein [Chloroflexi bacterium]|nr:metallopeptidase family protein [Chloroflexota bacterium]